jgi:hypothetical protein
MVQSPDVTIIAYSIARYACEPHQLVGLLSLCLAFLVKGDE